MSDKKVIAQDSFSRAAGLQRPGIVTKSLSGAAALVAAPVAATPAQAGIPAPAAPAQAAGTTKSTQGT